MKNHVTALEHPDVTAEEQSSQDLIKRIQKLRWIGMDVEAERIRNLLQYLPLTDSVLAGPHETD